MEVGKKFILDLIAYFIITNVITFVQFFMFLFVKFLDSIDIKINNLKGPRSRENLKNKRYNLVDIEGKILIRNNDKI